MLVTPPSPHCCFPVRKSTFKPFLFEVPPACPPPLQQINGVANRTTIADGNTWNHEHIALLGKCLVSPEAQSHAITRHLADYVLIWTTRHAGMYSDDLAKSPHMARIAGSVYTDINPQVRVLASVCSSPLAHMPP